MIAAHTTPLPELSTAPTSRIDDPELKQLVFDELRLTARLVRRLRIFVVGLLLTLAVLMLLTEHSVTRFVVVMVAALALGALVVADRTGLDPSAPVTARRLWIALGTALVLQTLIIVFTGGIESPFLVIYVPIMIFVAVVAGERRRFLLVFSLPLAIVTVLAVGFAVGAFDDLLPSFLAEPVVRAVLAGVVVLAVVFIGGTVGLSARTAVERSMRFAEEARRRSLDLLLERNRELLALSGALAHELKNPLTAIRGLASVLGRKLPSDSREAEQLGVLASEATRMGAILEEFLNFSRPSRDLVIEEISPEALVDDVVTLHESYAARRDISFHVRFDLPGSTTSKPSRKRADQPLRCDGRKVRQVLVNLVQNALDASPDGGQITLGAMIKSESGGRSERDGAGEERIVFYVDDSGPGLDEDVRGRLFTPGTTTKAAGSGLGLTIAQAIAHQHGGELTLENRGGGGCRATFELPLDRPAEEPAP